MFCILAAIDAAFLLTSLGAEFCVTRMGKNGQIPDDVG